MKRLEIVQGLIDRVTDELDLAMDKNKPYLRAALIELEQKLLAIRTEVYKLNRLIKELKGE